jgi:hypothetical protein
VLDQIAMTIDVKDREFFYSVCVLVLISQDSVGSQTEMFS